MKEWAEALAIVASFVVFCIVAGYLLMNLIAGFGETIPPMPVW